MAAAPSTLTTPTKPDKPVSTKATLPRSIRLKIDTTKIPSVISIFGVEHFNLNACLAKNILAKNPVCIQNTLPDEPKTLEEAMTPAGAGPAAGPAGAGAGAATGAAGAGATGALEELSRSLGANTVVSQNSESYVYKTRKEFEHLYLPPHLEKPDKKLMIKVFRFVFGKTDSTIDRDFVSKLLTPFDKVPCKQGSQVKVWEMFKECIEYRMTGSEESAAKDTPTTPNTAKPSPNATNTPVAKKQSMGLNKELGSLQKILPAENQEYKDKQYLRAQLLRMKHVLNEQGKTCVVFSETGADLNLSEYHTAILELLRKTMGNFIQNPLPLDEEEKDRRFLELMMDLKDLKPQKGDNRAIYNDMIRVVQGIFDTLSSSQDNLDALGKVQGKLKELLEGIATQKGGALADVDGEVDAEEEYERVFSSAMEHAKGSILSDVCEELGGTDLESSIEHAVSKKGFDLHAIMSRLHELNTDGNKHAKSFLRCVETLLEIKHAQYNTYSPPPPLAPGKERYLHTLAEYPSLKQYIPKDIFNRGDLSRVRNKLRRIYPYTDTLIEDISEIRKSPDPCCLFYKGTLAKLKEKGGKKHITRIRQSCKKICETIPKCEELLEEILVLASSVSVVPHKLHFMEVSLPKGFSLLAEAIREMGVLRDVPSLPITIHEESPQAFQAVLGETPFLLVGSGNTMTGIKGYEIDVSEDIEAIRKGEISIGTIMFLYLYIKCDRDVDA